MPDEEKQEKKEPEMAACPCCGQPTLKKPVKVDGKIVDDYLSSIMTGVPFNHMFSMFEGKLRITVSVANREEGRKLYRFVMLVEPFAKDYSSIQDLLGLVNTYCSISKIEVKDKNKDSHIYYPSQHVTEKCSELLDKWDFKNLHQNENMDAFLEDVKQIYKELSNTEILSSTPPSILTHVINDFRALETIMLEAGFDENFWKGIELH